MLVFTTLLVAAFSLLVKAAIGGNLYPWLKKATIIPSGSHRHNCSGNRTKFDYSRFATLVRDAGSLKSVWSKIGADIVGSLIGYQSQRNRHMHICPHAVRTALMIHILNQMYLSSHTKKDEAWEAAWREVSEAYLIVEMLDVELDCFECGQQEKVTVRHIAEQDGWQAASDWLRRDQASAVALLHPWQPYFSAERDLSDQGHFNVVRDVHSILEGFRHRNILHTWLVSHSTLLTALRYGHSRGVVLPSGFREDVEVMNMDMDVYLLTHDWAKFVNAIIRKADTIGLSCGWMPGWPGSSLVCQRKSIEVEFHWIEKQYGGRGKPDEPHRLVHALTPLGRCRLAPGPGVEGEAFDLPCPRDPWTFMDYAWQHLPQYMECYALPVGRSGTHTLSPEDVQFLWQRAVDLANDGYLSMLPYFGRCHNHPNSVEARLLYYDGWETPYPGQYFDVKKKHINLGY